MSIKRIQDILVNKIESNFENYLNEYEIDPPKVTTEFVDFDKFKHNFVCFVEFESISFQRNDRFSDSCSKTGHYYINIYLVFRNGLPEDIQNDNFLNIMPLKHLTFISFNSSDQ